MSAFTDFRDKPDTQKLALVEVDFPWDVPFWLNFEAGIWRFKVEDALDDITFNFGSGFFTQGAFGTSGVADLGLNDETRVVGSLKANDIDYSKVTSFADLRSTNKSFYYTGGTLYVHFDSYDPPSVFDIIVGITSGYSTQAKYFNNVLYESRVKSLPSVSMERDALFFGLITFGGGSFSLRNNDGEFDSWKDEDIYGQAMRIKFGGDDLDFSDYYTVFTGFVEDYTIDTETIDIDFSDDRKRFSRNLPVNVFDVATYPDIKTRNVNKPIPIAYGTVTNALIMCIDEAAGSAEATYNFVICDTEFHGITAINQIYIDKGDGPVAASADSQSLTAATFVLSGGSAVTEYEPGDDVTADFEGLTSGSSLISNGLDIISDILDHYVFKPFNSSIYDTTEWASAQAVTYNCAQWISKKRSIADIIEDLSVSNFGNFIVKPDGKYTFRTVDFDRATATTITKEQQLNMPVADFDATQFLSSVIVNYDKDQQEDDFIVLPDTTRESAVFNTYGTYREKEFDTAITNASDAAAFGSAVMDFSEAIVPIFNVTTKTQNIDLVLMDNIALEVDRVESTWFGLRKVEIIGITYNLNDFQVQLTCRDIEGLSAAVIETFPGEWTIDAPVFSSALGSGSADVWDKGWTADQKLYARQNFGYWTDDDGYVDSTDPDSYLISRWDED